MNVGHYIDPFASGYVGRRIGPSGQHLGMYVGIRGIVMMIYISKIQLARQLKDIAELREGSYDRATDRYNKTWKDCIETILPDEDEETKQLVFVLACWPADTENFIKKYL